MFQEAKTFERSGECHVGMIPRLPSEGRRVEQQLAAAKRAFTTRRVVIGAGTRLITNAAPKTGDLLLAKVAVLGHHQKLESPGGRRAQLYEGDTILVAYGERYAPDQFEAVVPPDLGPCDLVAGGGVAGKVLARHARVRKATALKPIGLVAGPGGEPLNLRDFALPSLPVPAGRPRVIAVAGTSMNAGKTTAAAGLIHGLACAGLNVTAAKITGTGSGNDYWSMQDAGARSVRDFTDMGFASTAGLDPEEVEQAAQSLIAHCAAERPDVIVVELADGLFQRETAALLVSPAFRQLVDGFLFAARDAMGALGGRDWLQAKGHHVVGVSGLMTASPLASREAAEAMGTAVITLGELRDPVFAPTLAFGDDGRTHRARACA